MTAKHSPMPWSVWTSNSWRRIGSDAVGGMSVCEPTKQPDGHPDLFFRNGGPSGPDARLICAAPDLLAALRDCLSFLENDCGPNSEPERRIARAAILKATGDAA
jgi:hypothetical protein